MYFGEYELLIIKMNEFIKMEAQDNYGDLTNVDYLFGLRCFKKNMDMNMRLNEYNRKDVFNPNKTHIKSVSCIQIDRIDDGVVYIAGMSDLYKDSKTPYPVFNMDNLLSFVKDFFYLDNFISKECAPSLLTNYPFYFTLVIPKSRSRFNYDSILEKSNIERFVFNEGKDIDVLINFLK